jgi:hypothetical protein
VYIEQKGVVVWSLNINVIVMIVKMFGRKALFVAGLAALNTIREFRALIDLRSRNRTYLPVLPACVENPIPKK